MPSPTDFNISPYYDDFTESKNFHRVLYRPTFAVQARELSTQQSILQNQIEKFGDHVFKQGAMVIPGEIGFDLNYYAVKLSAKSLSTLSDYEGVKVTGATSGVEATVVNSVVTDGTDPDTIYVKYLKTGTDLSAETFTDGETLNCTVNDAAATLTVDTTATGCAAEIQAGVYYINGFFVSVANQVLILDKYTNTPSYRVGLTISESFITSNDDASLNDNATGSSNANAPGAHRFKISLTLAKLSLTSTSDTNFLELLRLKEGKLQNQVRTTEYSVLEDTFARRTFDESGNYVVRPFDIDIRESAISGTNRGIYTDGATTDDGNTASSAKLAIGLAPGKAYVQGYEIETVGTTYKDVDKARDFSTQNNYPVRYNVENYINVTNVYGAPDVGFVSGNTEAYKSVTLSDTLTSSRGTATASSGVTVPEIGRAKSKGFEYVSGSASSNIFASSSLTSAVYRHYLFDLVLFTHLNVLDNTAFTTGETVTGGTSGATGIVESLTAVKSATISGATQADPVVVTATGHTFVEGQQVTISSVTGMTELNDNVYTVRNPGTNDFELYDTDGTTSIDGTGFSAYSSGGAATHGVVVLSAVKGTFSAGETITGGTSSNSSTIQADAVGFLGVHTNEIADVKQVYMAGSPAYTADVSLDSTYGENTTLTGTMSVANSGTAVTGFGTSFQTELQVGDQLQFTTDGGTSLTRLVEAIISDTSLTLSAAVGGSDVTTKSNIIRRRSKINGNDKNLSVFRLPYNYIKTLKTTLNSGVTDTNFSVRRQFIITALDSNGTGTINTSTNETFTSLAEGDYTVSIMTTGAGGSGAVGDVLSLSGNNHESATIFNLGGSPSGSSLTLDFGANYQGHKLKIIATVQRTVAGSKTKTLVEDAETQVSTQAAAQNRDGVNFGKADIYQLKNVYMSADFSTDATSSDTDVTYKFNLDNGQRDNYYDVGRLILKPGELQPTGRLLIVFDYFTHGTGDYFDVDSYTSQVDYENIPAYTSKTGERYELRDSLDFRPRVDDATTIGSGTQDRSFDGSGASTVDVVKFNSNAQADFEFYLARIDKIFLDREGKFKVVKGTSDINPPIPANIEGAIHLYTLSLPAYTTSTEGIDIKKVDNKRYTMRDIGKLEGRIDNLEYYTQLSLLETQAQNLQIQDADGFDRFKNGFIVDNFTGHNVGDVGNIDYKIAMDMAKGEMRPTHSTKFLELIESDDDGTTILSTDRSDANYQKTGQLITLPYEETNMIEQPYASTAINVNPFDVTTFVGNIDLSPSSDQWKETERAPELVVNNSGGWDTLVSGLGNSGLNEVEIGTIWNDWQDFWSGTPTDIATRDVGGQRREGRRIFTRTEISSVQQVSQTRTGIRQTLVPQTVRNSIGDKIVSVAFVPFIRSKEITFTATRMKPNTRVYPFFDNIDVSSYTSPTGASLFTDANGAVTGTFTIPDPKVDANPRWRSGQRVFRLTSSSTNSKTASDVITSAEADYLAQGLLETVQNTVISTREPRLVRQSTTDSRSITRTSTRESTRTIGWVDPVAQTFLIDDEGGAFVTSVDLYFSTKAENIPVTVQIREVVNGYPSNKILPFGEVTLNPSSVNVSTDASTATTFTFPSPVYLQENTEYAFVVLANTTEYNIYIGRLGEKIVGSDRTISSAPYAGVLFKSQNGSTWTADQNEDIKFIMKRAEFSNVTGTVTTTENTTSAVTLKSNPIRTTNSSGVIRVFHKNHGMHGTNNNVTIAGSAAVNGITAEQINTTFTSISNVTLDTYEVTTAGTATASGDGGGSSVTATENIYFDVLNLNTSILQVPGTSVRTFVRPTSGRSIHGSETEFSLTTVANKIAVVPGDNIYFTSPKIVASDINKTNESIGNKSLYVTYELSTTATNLSPVIDLDRVGAFATQNRINSPTSGNTPDFVAETVDQGFSSAATYITRVVNLENTSTALDIRLSANVRSTSEIEVYYRTLGIEDDRKINEVGFVGFNGDGSEDTTVPFAEDSETFKEYKYSESNIPEFSTFQIKIVLKGTNSSLSPVVRDMRGIALAV